MRRNSHSNGATFETAVHGKGDTQVAVGHREDQVVFHLSDLRSTVWNLSTVRAGATLSWLAPHIVSSVFRVATGLLVIRCAENQLAHQCPIKLYFSSNCVSCVYEFLHCKTIVVKFAVYVYILKFYIHNLHCICICSTAVSVTTGWLQDMYIIHNCS